MARPSKLTQDRHELIVQAVRAGNYREPTARAAGIGPSTLYRWLETGEADAEAEKDSPERELWEAVTRAEGEAEVHAVAILRRAMSEDWRAAVEYLKRRSPERWSATENVKHQGEVKHAHGIDYSKLTPEELEQLERLVDRATE